VCDAPEVGANLADHIDFTLNVRVRSTQAVGYSLRGFARMAAQLPSFVLRGEGMWSSNVAEAGGFIKSEPSLTRPDLTFARRLSTTTAGACIGGTATRCTCACCGRKAGAM
jgi:choline dehydrogenase-like flavoprotein